MNDLVSIKVNQATLDEMKEDYSPFIIPNDGEYIYFFANVNGLLITGYSSKGTKRTVTFKGVNALEEARKWDTTAEVSIETKKTIQAKWLCLDNQIGSDEVGVGDFVLPMIVVAAFVRKKDINMLKTYGVTDSKKLSDSQIMEIGEALASKFFFSKLTITNEKYNEMYTKSENLNSLKAKMHNRALLNLFKQFPDTKNIFVDQFCKPELFYRYLNDPNEPVVGDITFRTKGESYYPSVALASVMARYSFLKEKAKLEEKYKMKFPFGAGKDADEFAIKFIKKYGKKEFDKIAKKNFANYKSL